MVPTKLFLCALALEVINAATLLPKTTASLNQLFREDVEAPEIPISDNVQLLTAATNVDLDNTLPKRSVSISKQRDITVVGKGVIHAEADIAIVHCEARAENADPGKAKEALDESVTSLLADMTGLGIAKENITHLDLRIEKRYNWKDGKQTFMHYEGYQPIEILVPLAHEKSASSGVRANVLLEKVVNRLLVASSADFEMTHISLKVTNPAPYISAARQQAVENAVDAAKEIATALDMTVGLPVKVRLFHADGTIHPQPRFVMKAVSAAMDNEASASPVANRKIEFEASVEVTFDIYASPSQQCPSQNERLLDIHYTR